MLIFDALSKQETQNVFAANVDFFYIEVTLSESVTPWPSGYARLCDPCIPAMQHILSLLKAFDSLLGKQVELTLQLCTHMAQDTWLEPQEAEVLSHAAYFHHIGLLGFKRKLLRRALEDPNSLNPRQLRRFKQHPIHSANLAQELGLGEAIRLAIHTHHEHWDGSGYPLGLSKNEISRPAQALAIASFYAESALSPEATYDALQAHSGHRFCPEALRLFFKTCAPHSLPPKIRDILAQEAQPGMVLATPLYTATGLMIFPADQPLSPQGAQTLQNHSRQDLIDQRILIYWPR